MVGGEGGVWDLVFFGAATRKRSEEIGVGEGFLDMPREMGARCANSVRY